MGTAQTQGAPVESPRAVANKSERQHLLKAIRMALSIESPAVRSNTQTFNRNRYRATGLLPDYDVLKDHARQLKARSIANLPQLIAQLEKTVRGRGGHVHLAAGAEEACRYVRDVCVRHGAKLSDAARQRLLECRGWRVEVVP